MSATTEPCVLLERTKTRGYRISWVSSKGAKVVRHRGIVDYEDALRHAARLARLHDCHIEAAP
jgi:hypothetical protein